MDNNIITERRISAFVVFGIVLLIITAAVTYAYFTAEIQGSEEEDTVTLKGGIMQIAFDGGKIINLEGAFPKPGPVATKDFTVTGNNTTVAPMNYTLTLKVTENTFSSNVLKYRMIGTNDDGSGSTVPDIVDLTDIETGAQDIFLGSGTFGATTGGDKVHSYSLEIHFPSSGVIQNEEQNKNFSGYVQILGIE